MNPFDLRMGDHAYRTAVHAQLIQDQIVAVREGLHIWARILLRRRARFEIRWGRPSQEGA